MKILRKIILLKILLIASIFGKLPEKPKYSIENWNVILVEDIDRTSGRVKKMKVLSPEQNLIINKFLEEWIKNEVSSLEQLADWRLGLNGDSMLVLFPKEKKDGHFFSFQGKAYYFYAGFYSEKGKKMKLKSVLNALFSDFGDLDK